MTSLTATVADTRSPVRVPTVVRLGNGTALAALVAALVLGILGMHALANHGTPSAVAAAATAPGDPMTDTSSDALAMTSMATGASHDGHDHAAAAHSSPASAVEGAAPASSGQHTHDTSGMVMLCVVMLAAAALTLLALLVVRRLRRLLPAAFEPIPPPSRTMRWVRGTGPPPVWRFSVVRC